MFEIGLDSNGKADVRSIEYPEDWPIEKVQEAISNREKVLHSIGCPHCKKINKSIKPPKRRLFGFLRRR